MSQAMIISIIKDSLVLVLITAGPILLVALVVGFAISIFQATTQIQEQTLTFVPKIVAVFLFVIVMLPYMMGKLTDFTMKIFENIANVLR